MEFSESVRKTLKRHFFEVVKVEEILDFTKPEENYGDYCAELVQGTPAHKEWEFRLCFDGTEAGFIDALKDYSVSFSIAAAKRLTEKILRDDSKSESHFTDMVLEDESKRTTLEKMVIDLCTEAEANSAEQNSNVLSPERIAEAIHDVIGVQMSREATNNAKCRWCDTVLAALQAALKTAKSGEKEKQK